MSTQSEIRQEITHRIVDALKRGVAPWRRPWSGPVNAGPPANVVSGKPYTGVNVLLLGLAGYETRWWATHAQVKALGGRVRKGERATRVVYCRQVEKVTIHATGDEEVETFPVLTTYFVYNLAQTTGLEQYLARPGIGTPIVDFGPAERVIAATHARIEYGGGRTAYSAADDLIRLPPPEAFESQAAYYGTAS